MAHSCPKKKIVNGGSSTTNTNNGNVSSSSETDNLSLKFAEKLFDVLRDYIRLKTKELESAKVERK
jgi:hypothetical protein